MRKYRHGEPSLEAVRRSVNFMVIHGDLPVRLAGLPTIVGFNSPLLRAVRSTVHV